MIGFYGASSNSAITPIDMGDKHSLKTDQEIGNAKVFEEENI